MRNSYVDGGGEWWTSSGTRNLDESLPAGLLDDLVTANDQETPHV
jgi:hypothetical protein